MSDVRVHQVPAFGVRGVRCDLPVVVVDVDPPKVEAPIDPAELRRALEDAVGALRTEWTRQWEELLPSVTELVIASAESVVHSAIERGALSIEAPLRKMLSEHAEHLDRSALTVALHPDDLQGLTDAEFEPPPGCTLAPDTHAVRGSVRITSGATELVRTVERDLAQLADQLRISASQGAP